MGESSGMYFPCIQISKLRVWHVFVHFKSNFVKKRRSKGKGGLKNPPPHYRNFWYHFGKMVNLFFRKFEQWYVFASDLTMLSDIIPY